MLVGDPLVTRRRGRAQCIIRFSQVLSSATSEGEPVPYAAAYIHWVAEELFGQLEIFEFRDAAGRWRFVSACLEVILQVAYDYDPAGAAEMQQEQAEMAAEMAAAKAQEQAQQPGQQQGQWQASTQAALPPGPPERSHSGRPASCKGVWWPPSRMEW